MLFEQADEIVDAVDPVRPDGHGQDHLTADAGNLKQADHHQNRQKDDHRIARKGNGVKGNGLALGG